MGGRYIVCMDIMEMVGDKREGGDKRGIGIPCIKKGLG
jgi:hypothetical protein